MMAIESHGSEGWFQEYLELLHDPAHLLLELTLIIVVDVLIGMLLWPFAKKWLKNHDSKKHGHQHCEEVHQEPFDPDNNYAGDRASDYRESGNNQFDREMF